MLKAVLAGAVAILLGFGVATAASSAGAHRSIMSHVAAEAGSVDAAPSDHPGERHPGMGVHLAGACAAILAAALLVLGLLGRVARGERTLQGHLRRLASAWDTDVVHIAGVGPPRVSLCVELR